MKKMDTFSKLCSILIIINIASVFLPIYWVVSDPQADVQNMSFFWEDDYNQNTDTPYIHFNFNMLMTIAGTSLLLGGILFMMALKSLKNNKNKITKRIIIAANIPGIVTFASFLGLIGCLSWFGSLGPFHIFWIKGFSTSNPYGDVNYAWGFGLGLYLYLISMILVDYLLYRKFKRGSQSLVETDRHSQLE